MKILTIILGIFLLVGGFYCVFTPVATYAAIAWLIGLSMIIEGVASVITWSEMRRLGLANGLTLVGSILSIVLGVFLLGSHFLQFAVDMFIAYLIAIWLIVAGITRIVAAISVSSTVPYMSLERMNEMVDVVKDAAARISAELGWKVQGGPAKTRDAGT